MKKLSVIFSVIVMLAFASPSQAFTWDFADATGNGGYTSPYAAANVVTFDAALPAGWSLTGNYQITTGTAGDAAAPWWDADGSPAAGLRDLTNYLSVPLNLSDPATTRTATLSFGGSFNNYFGLWWGSMDTYNTFEFLAADLST